MALWDFDPFREMDLLQRRLDRLYDSPALLEGKGGGREMARTGESRLGTWRPQFDVRETDKELIVHADVPGVDEKDLNLSIDNGMLTISGKREQTKKEENERCYRMERSFGSFTRSIQLGEDVDPNQVKANFENGVLEVRLPRSGKAQTKKIPIATKKSAK